MTLNVCEKYYALNENFKLWPSFLQIILKQFFHRVKVLTLEETEMRQNQSTA